VLKSIDFSDFMVSMAGYFRDDHNIFFLLEFLRGRELWDVIRDMGKLIKLT